MSAPAASNNIHIEWSRLELLAECVANNRLGKRTAQSRQEELKTIHSQVGTLRQQQPWHDVVAQCQLNTMDQDILACALAPECSPQLGWMFQELQPGLGSAYPSPALIQELLCIGYNESRLLHERLLEKSPLTRHQLLETRGRAVEKYQPIKPSAKATEVLLGVRPIAPEIPGAIKIPSGGTWHDLVLTNSSLTKIKEFMLWLSHRNVVENEWGGKILGGPVALFSGPSGTGKTFAAGVIAKELGWPLYRVDLGLLVSKYVGETEKNVSQLLDAAHGRKVVLLFDEADSLFGKRAEVRDARDRYANMEVGHLLSKIERHDGPCILTSNFRQNLDPAFTRRFQMVVEFSRPDADARDLLWRKHLPKKAPLDNNLDFGIIADAVNLTGGQIRNAALHAAFLAAASGRPISMCTIAHSILSEFAKEGRELSATRLGRLQNFLQREVEL